MLRFLLADTVVSRHADFGPADINAGDTAITALAKQLLLLGVMLVPGDDAMKSPVVWYVFLMGLLVSWTVAIGQEDEAETEDSVLDCESIEPYLFVEPDAGFRFQADVLAWTRTNPGGSGPVIGGPETFSLGPLSNSYTGGYRLSGGWLIDPNYEAEAVWTSFNDWTANGGGVLSRAISFNNGQASTLVDPSGNANFINTGTFFRPVYDAAIDPLANPAIQNYAYLKGGSTYTIYSNSTLNDFQANFKTRRSEVQRFSFGLGYRHIALNEGTTAAISGVFGTNDIPGGGTTNNVLSNDALRAHGLSLLSGAADGWTNNPANATTLVMLWNGNTTNQMNGVQATFDASLLQKRFFTLEGVVRTGIFYNEISGSVHEVYTAGGADDSVYGRTLSDSRDVFSFASNLGLNGVFQVTNHLRLRAGYELMFLTNTALSADQQAGVTYNSLGVASYHVQGGSTVVFHGARAGLEYIW